MNKLLFLLSLLFFVSCKRTKIKSLPSKVDSVVNKINAPSDTYHDHQRLEDSLLLVHLRDSLYSIKIKSVFIADEKYTAFDKLIRTVVDTSTVKRRKEIFSDTVLIKYDNKQKPFSASEIFRNKSFTIELRNENIDAYLARKLFINGKELKPGKDIDIILGGYQCMHHLRIDGQFFETMRFGSKEYLYMQGYFDQCTGVGCGVIYFILYDPEIQKAMILEQFRNDFFNISGNEINVGNKSNGVPLFLVENIDHENFFPTYYFKYSGKFYNFSESGKVIPAVDKRNQQYFFDGYMKLDEEDKINIVKSNLPTN